MREEILDRRTAYAGKLINLEVARVRLADGHETEREVVHHPGAVAVVALARSTATVAQDWQVLLVRQFRLPADEALLELPAGTAEAGEDPQETARRELAEEVGRQAGSWHELASFYTSPGYSDERITLYLALDLAPTKGEPEADEALEVVLIPLALAHEAIRNGEIRDAKTITGILLALDWLDRHPV